MNLSTPLRYLTWYLKRYTTASRPFVSVVHALAMAVYATVRLGLCVALLFRWEEGIELTRAR